MVSVAVLFAVISFIFIRDFLPWRLPLWVVMVVAALVLILAQQISLQQAYNAIDQQLILYLTGMFVMVAALEQSGDLERCGQWIFCRAHSGFQALALVVFGFGLSSALLLNDTIAIVGAVLILKLTADCRNMRQPLLLALAFAIGIGSTLTPMGNPQNLLIAIQGQIPHPILFFVSRLWLPTLLALLFLFAFMGLLYRKCLQAPLPMVANRTPQRVETRLKWAGRLGAAVFLTLLLCRVVFSLFHINIHISWAAMAMASALVVLLVLSGRRRIVAQIDWGTLALFVGLFVLMASVWQTGLLQRWVIASHAHLNDKDTILLLSVLGSQVVSNVPWVIMALPMLLHVGAGSGELLTLAVGSTLAGNIMPMAAASTLIIAERVEKNDFSFWRFLFMGLPLTAVLLFLYRFFV